MPCYRKGALEHGHLEATLDPEIIGTWFTIDFPGAGVGVHMGASGLVALDIDVRPDQQKDGYVSLDAQWLEIPETYAYETSRGGRHLIYAAPQDVALNGQANYRGWVGVDRKAGSSYVFWRGEAPTDRTAFAASPSWLNDPAGIRVGESFEGGLDEWLSSLPEGNPDAPVRAAIDRIPTDDFDHTVLIQRQFELIRLAAEGHPGVGFALEALREAWLRDEYNTPDYAYEFDSGLNSGVIRYGAVDEAIRALPDYRETLALLGAHHVALLVGLPEPKRHYFSTLRKLASTDLSDDQIAALMWGAPTVKTLTREWGLEYLYEQIGAARKKNAEEGAPSQNPTLTKTENPTEKHEGITLLTPLEREYLEQCAGFNDRYIAWCATKVSVLNMPYHRMNAWTILSLAFGLFGFVPEREGPMGLNLSQLGLGESSTGKTRALKLRDAVLEEFFHDDMGFDLGSDASVQALHAALLERDGKASFFNADEAAATFAQMLDAKWLAGMEATLTKFYEGKVPPMLRRGDKGAEKGRSALTSFNIAMYGTPRKVTNVLTKDMFESGFLARFVWEIGDPPLDGDEQYSLSQMDTKAARLEFDPIARGFAQELIHTRSSLSGTHHPILATKEALARMGKASKAMKAQLIKHPQWDILEPAWKRLSAEAVRKVASLLVLSEGGTRLEMRHALYAIRQAEFWATNVAKVSEDITASVFQRDCDEMELFLRSRGGSCSESMLAHRFRNVGTGDPREFMARVESLRMQGRIVKHEATASKGVHWAVNTNG